MAKNKVASFFTGHGVVAVCLSGDVLTQDLELGQMLCHW